MREWRHRLLPSFNVHGSVSLSGYCVCLYVLADACAHAAQACVSCVRTTESHDCNIASKTQPLLSSSKFLLPRLPGMTQLPQPTKALVARLLSLMQTTLMIIQVNVTDIHSV